MMFGTSFPCSKALILTVIAPSSSGSRIGLIITRLRECRSLYTEQLGDEHQQQDPRRALPAPAAAHLVDRIVEIHSRQLVKEKTKGGDRGGGDDRRISAEKEAETFGGLVSGILIFSPLRPSASSKSPLTEWR